MELKESVTYMHQVTRRCLHVQVMRNPLCQLVPTIRCFTLSAGREAFQQVMLQGGATPGAQKHLTSIQVVYWRYVWASHLKFLNFTFMSKCFNVVCNQVYPEQAGLRSRREAPSSGTLQTWAGLLIIMYIIIVFVEKLLFPRADI